MLNPLTEFVARLQSWFNRIGGTSIYGRELNWEDMPPIPVVNVGYAGATSTGKPKIWPSADSTGYHPGKGVAMLPQSRTYCSEIAVGSPYTVSTNATRYVTIIKPAAATLEVAGATTMTIPATTQDLAFSTYIYGQVVFTAGVASSFIFDQSIGGTTVTTTTR